MSLSQLMGNMELSTVMSPENVRVIQLALYYDFVLYNMQQKPFGVLLVSGGGAIGNRERGTMVDVPNKAQPSLFVKIDTVKELHDALVQCLSDKSKCDINGLNEHVEYLKETLYRSEKIDEFKTRGKTTPAELYDLLNPGNGDINAAIQKAVRQIKEYPAAAATVYLGDEVLNLIFRNAAVHFLDGNTVAAMRSIMDDGIALPKRIGGRTQRRGTKRRGTKRRGTKRRGTKRHNRRGRTRRH